MGLFANPDFQRGALTTRRPKNPNVARTRTSDLYQMGAGQGDTSAINELRRASRLRLADRATREAGRRGLLLPRNSQNPRLTRRTSEPLLPFGGGAGGSGGVSGGG